jgi:hypothetical protein
MNNEDRYKIAKREGARQGARVAIGNGRGKGSRNGAWNWADEAIAQMELAGIPNARQLAGDLSWPDFDALSAALEGKGN